MQIIIDEIICVLMSIVASLVNLLPDSPFQLMDTSMEDVPGFENVMSHVNYFVPVGGMLSILSTYLVSVSVYYLVRVALKMTQAL